MKLSFFGFFASFCQFGSFASLDPPCIVPYGLDSRLLCSWLSTLDFKLSTVFDCSPAPRVLQK